jgi:hypothetical protein
MSVETIRRALSGRAVLTTDEEELGNAVAQLLNAAGVAFEREVRLSPRDRIDFMVGSVGVELKVDGSLAQLIRQLDRYAQHERVSELVLVSTRRKHLLLPSALREKRVAAICLGGL